MHHHKCRYRQNILSKINGVRHVSLLRHKKNTLGIDEEKGGSVQSNDKRKGNEDGED